MLDRLPFQLPDFTRIAWTSDKARIVWGPRIEQISRAWHEIEWRSVADGVRPCALTRLSETELASKMRDWAAAGLTHVILGTEGAPDGIYSSHPRPVVPGKPVSLRIVVGRTADLVEFQNAWQGSDEAAIGALLGYPACCTRFFQATWIDRKQVDTTWDMAANTAPHATDRVDGSIELREPSLGNVLWRWVGVRAVPHLPCSYSCEATITMAERMLSVGERAGYVAEMAWLREILTWPVEWSALHGIAEIKTPVLKISTRTDATCGKYVVRLRGLTLPAEAAKGLVFPFHAPVRRRISDSAAFQRGIDQPVGDGGASTPSWYHLDNGFDSRQTMERMHGPIVAWVEGLSLDRGNVIDLGCGNGALLKKICAQNPGLIPFGVDLKRSAIDHARLLHPGNEGNFWAGNLFDPRAWGSGN